MKKFSVVFCGIRKYGAIVLDQLIKHDCFDVIQVYSKKEDFSFSPSCQEICKREQIPIVEIDQWDQEVVKNLEDRSVDILLRIFINWLSAL